MARSLPCRSSAASHSPYVTAVDMDTATEAMGALGLGGRPDAQAEANVEAERARVEALREEPEGPRRLGLLNQADTQLVPRPADMARPDKGKDEAAPAGQLAAAEKKLAAAKKERDAAEQKRNVAKKERDVAEQKRDVAEQKRDVAKKERDAAEKKRDKYRDLFFNETTDAERRAAYKQAWDDAEASLKTAEVGLAGAEDALTTARRVWKRAENALADAQAPSDASSGSPRSSPGSSGSGGGGGKRGHAITSEALRDFWDRLADATVTNSVLELAGGTRFLGSSRFPTRLFVREHYEALWGLTHPPSQVRATVLLGTPGIGKSCFLLWLLWKLKREAVPVVVYESDEVVFVFHQDGAVVEAKSRWEVRGLLRREDCWYLVDAKKPSLNCAGRTILVSSPNRKIWANFEKQLGATVRYLPVFSEEEMEACRAGCFPKLDADGVAARFKCYGGVARGVLERAAGCAADGFRKAFDRGLSSLTLDIDWRNLERLSEKDDRVVHRVIHYDVTDLETFLDFRFVFASPTVTLHVVKRYTDEKRRELTEFLRFSASISTLAGVRGQLFEHWAHGVLREGGTFRGRRLDREDGEKEDKWPPRVLRLFHAVKELMDHDHEDALYLPVAKNNESVDSVVPGQPPLLLQMTVSNRHGAKAPGLKAVLDALGVAPEAARLVFVVPIEQYAGFGKQAIDKGKTGTQALVHAMERIPQFVLGLEFKE